jgi:PTS system N-acetylgalactosamine-specific IIA component
MTTNSGAASAAGPRAVVAGHGTVAAALVDAVGRIAGRAGAFRAVSNQGLSAGSLEAVLRQALAEHGASVIFTDLPAGSCTLAARRIARTDPAVAVVTGASVGMLLDFALGTGEAPGDLERIVARARDAMIAFPPTGASRAG